MNIRIESRVFGEVGIDRGVLTGAILCGLLLLIGMAWGGQLLRFLDLPSLLLVVGGTFGATLISFSLEDCRYAWLAFKGVIKNRIYDPSERISQLVRLAQLAKTSGTVVLEREADYADENFLRMALQITADGQPADDIRRILETERKSSNERAFKAVQVFETLGAYAPALGLIGTLIGLIQMLGALDNPATVGPSMAYALVTTLYGAVSSNLVFLPIAGKLRNRAEEDALLKALTIEGMISISKQENALIVEQRLQSFLPDRSS